MKIKVFEAFAGYGSQSLALERLKKAYPDFDYEMVGISEIDKYAIQAYNTLHPGVTNYGDISKIDWNQVPKLFAKYSNKPHSHSASVYTLVNFDTTFEQDLERIYTLRELGYWAYVMVYDKEHCDRKYKDLQRWVNNRIIFAKCEKFEDYKPDYSYSQL
jgi:hypothetical protein